MKYIKIIAFLLCLLPLSYIYAEDDVFMLTRPIQYSLQEDLTDPQTLVPGKEITLLKRISDVKGKTKFQLIQLNGEEKEMTGFVSSDWFEAGAKKNTIIPFKLDPKKMIVKAISYDKDCNIVPIYDPKVLLKAEIEEYKKNPCSILTQKEISKEINIEEVYMGCLDSIKTKLNISYKDNAYKAISKLYTLPKIEQSFMAKILTMYGEASGTKPPSEQMSAVLKVIENRTRVVKENYPEATELDVVLQNSQFSMFNPSDPNWRRALFADNDEIQKAIHVLAKKDEYKIKVDKKKKVDNIFHYMAKSLCDSPPPPPWVSDCKSDTKLEINKTSLIDKNGHLFFEDLKWAFNPNNRYVLYLKQVKKKNAK